MLDRCCPKMIQIWAASANVGRCLSSLGQVWATSGKVWPAAGRVSAPEASCRQLVRQPHWQQKQSFDQGVGVNRRNSGGAHLSAWPWPLDPESLGTPECFIRSPSTSPPSTHLHTTDAVRRMSPDLLCRASCASHCLCPRGAPQMVLFCGCAQVGGEPPCVQHPLGNGTGQHKHGQGVCGVCSTRRPDEVQHRRSAVRSRGSIDTLA